LSLVFLDHHTETTSDNTSKTTTDNTSKREERNSHSPNKRSKTEEEIINKKDIDNRFYSTSLDIEDCSDNSDNSEVIEGIPVTDEPYSYSRPAKPRGICPTISR
jgi:hypothetical protein